MSAADNAVASDLRSKVAELNGAFRRATLAGLRIKMKPMTVNQDVATNYLECPEVRIESIVREL